jgi:hypothetical protein
LGLAGPAGKPPRPERKWQPEGTGNEALGIGH